MHEKKTVLTFNLRKGIVLDTTAKVADSVMKSNNNRLNQKCKYIVVHGIKDLDTLSVYNENDIRTAAAFNNRRVYTSELSISLKYLGFLQNGANTFVYQILLNGMKTRTITIWRGPNATPETIAMAERMAGPAMSQNAILSSPTDFFGNYTIKN